MKVIQCTILVFGFASVASQTIPKAVLANTSFVPSNINNVKFSKKLCESDCDKNDDCAVGLWCADRYKTELKAIGLDERHANCDAAGAVKNTNTEWAKYEVCFDPKILGGGGAGGDPHFRTYDGTKYTYHGECDLIMAHSQLDDQNEMSLHARTKIIDDSWSLISNVALKIGDDTFEVDNDDVSHFFNGGKNVEFPILLAGKYEVTSQEQVVKSLDETDAETTTKQIAYIIDLAGKGSITITNYRRMLSVRVDSYLQDTYGMLGHRTKDGLVGRDGDTVVVENIMGAEWQVRDDEPMLFHEVDAPQYPERCNLPSVSSRNRHLRKADVTLEAAEKACKNVAASMKAFCIEDVIRSSDISLAHIYFASAW